VVVSSWFEPGNATYNVWVASDLWSDVDGMVEATWLDWSGNVLQSDAWRFNLSGLDSRQIYQATGWPNILPADATTDNSVLLLRLHATNPTTGEEFSNANYFVPNYISNSTIVDPGLQIEHLGSQSWKVTATKGVSAYTWLSAPSSVVGYFSENSFWLKANESKIVTFKLRGADVDSWEDQVTVRSIWDNTQAS
jgi:beta-mannosidase